MTNHRYNWRTFGYLFWPLLIIAGVLVLREQFAGQDAGAGRKLYNLHCSSCHGDQGEGLRRLIPPVANSDYVARSGAELACLLRYGKQGEIVVNGVVFNQPMAGIEELTDREIHVLVNFIKNWGNGGQNFDFAAIQNQLNQCDSTYQVP